jgi:hypothetical protein
VGANRRSASILSIRFRVRDWVGVRVMVKVRVGVRVRGWVSARVNLSIGMDRRNAKFSGLPHFHRGQSKFPS